MKKNPEENTDYFFNLTSKTDNKYLLNVIKNKYENSTLKTLPKLKCGDEGVNECNVVTIFNMGVSCSVQQPSTLTSSDGSATLIITGGTPPYTTKWSNNNLGPSIYNLSVGTYSAVTTDYYGDFTAYTQCVLTGTIPTPTPTITPTPTPLPAGYPLCVNIDYDGGSITETYQPNGRVNGNPSWSASTGEIIVWSAITNQWYISPCPISGFIVNNNPSVPPINGWVSLGAPSPQPVLVQVFTGVCPTTMVYNPLFRNEPISTQPLKINVNKNNPVCACEGSITISVKGGVPPYSYSINGGETYRNIPTFSNLCSGLYTVVVTDSIGGISNQDVVLNKTTNYKTYTVSLNTVSSIISQSQTQIIKEYTTRVIVTPQLDEGTILNFDLLHTSIFKSSPNIDSALNENISNLYRNSILVPITNSTTDNTITNNPIYGCQDKNNYLKIANNNWMNLQITNKDNIVLRTTNKIIKNELLPCYLGDNDEIFKISNIKLKGCICCTVVSN